MRVETLTIVGVGLIGGSIGLAVRRRGLARRIVGVGRHDRTLHRARELGAVDDVHLDLVAAVGQSDLIVFCTPVQLIAEQVLTASRHCPNRTLLTDAGSTKNQIITAIEGRLPDGIHFVGSHPLAGSEKRGPEHADAELFQDRLTVVTPTSRTNPRAVEQVCAFWEALGSRVRRMTPRAHDDALALTSHLPHLLASAMAGVLPLELHELTATGFLDTTRIAAGDPNLWTGIFLQNRGAVLGALARLTTQLGHFRSAIENDDATALSSLLHQAKGVRDALGS